MTTTEKARFLISVTTLKEFCDYVGMTAHTCYKRLNTQRWKNSEIIAIDQMLNDIKNKVSYVKRKSNP